jgi:murein hydrolase activator
MSPPTVRYAALRRFNAGARRLLFLVALAGALLAAPPIAGPRPAGASAPAKGGPAASAKSDPVAEKQKELHDLKSEIEANRKEIDSLKRKEKDLAAIQARIRRDHDLTLRYLNELSAQDSTLRQGLAERQVDLLDKEAAARDAADRLKRGLVRYYKMRRVGGPELLFSSRSFGELFARAQMLARMVRRERIELAALAEERQRISVDAAALEQRRRGVESLQEEKRRERARLQRQGTVARSQLEELRDERAERERNVHDLEASQAAIARMITMLERERTRERGKGDIPAADGTLAGMRGRLAWPVEGSIVGQFGFEVHPRYGTQVPSNGIDIAAPSGTPVRAVGAGVVEFVDWLPGYGRTVILNHGSGYYTLYAHASSVAVRRGEKVSAGQVIAAVGDTDSIKGECLHFEIRQGQRALNPKEWLR